MALERKSSGLSERADALLHPVRLRIVKVLETGQATPGKIAERLPDVPPATLYRHINKLADAGIIEVVERHLVHGTMERVFALVGPQSVLRYSDLTNASRAELIRFSRLFLSEVGDTVERYFRSVDVDLQRDAFVLFEQVVYVTPEEAQEIREAMRNLVQRYVSNPAGAGRQARSLTVLSVPEVSETAPGGKERSDSAND